MSTETSSKNVAAAVFYISIHATTDIAKVLRNFLSAVKYANVKYGEEHYKNYLKGEKGHKFKNELNFARITMDIKKSDVERIPVTEKDKRIIQEMAHNMNMDYCLMRRPDDLEKLIHKKFIEGVELTNQEEKIVRAFTIRDAQGKTVMDPEKPKLPLINNAEYMLLIASTDLNKWEYITRELEIQSHKPNLHERLKNAKVMSRVYSEYRQKLRDKNIDKKQERGRGK